MTKQNMTSMITTYTSQHVWFQYPAKYSKYTLRTDQNTHEIILHLIKSNPHKVVVVVFVLFWFV